MKCGMRNIFITLIICFQWADVKSKKRYSCYLNYFFHILDFRFWFNQLERICFKTKFDQSKKLNLYWIQVFRYSISMCSIKFTRYVYPSLPCECWLHYYWALAIVGNQTYCFQGVSTLETYETYYKLKYTWNLDYVLFCLFVDTFLDCEYEDRSKSMEEKDRSNKVNNKKTIYCYFRVKIKHRT